VGRGDNIDSLLLLVARLVDKPMDCVDCSGRYCGRFCPHDNIDSLLLLPTDGKQLNIVGGKDGRVALGKPGNALGGALLSGGKITPTLDVSSAAECATARLCGTSHVSCVAERFNTMLPTRGEIPKR